MFCMTYALNNSNWQELTSYELYSVDGGITKAQVCGGLLATGAVICGAGAIYCACTGNVAAAWKLAKTLQ